MDSKTLHRLATNPKAMLNYKLTGRLPSFVPPSSPLITLLQSLHPRERVQVASLTVSASLGYRGLHSFRNAQHALNWAVPEGTSSMPASASWQIKQYRKLLTVDDLKDRATIPVAVVDAWWSRHPHLKHLRISSPGG